MTDEPQLAIEFNSILRQVAIDPSDVVLLRHKDQRAAKGRTPYELWRDNRPAFELYQSVQSIRYRSTLTRASRWASFVGTAGGDTMFVGMYRARHLGLLQEDRPWPHADGVDKAGTRDAYDLELDPRFTELSGKLFIRWGRGERSWIQRADNQNKAITELRREFKEEEYPGHLNFIEPLSKLGSLPSGWVAVLKACAGVYLLTCPRTNEHYVGMASGKDGFWQRWQDYVQTGHGGNTGLKLRDPSDYQVTILEVAGSDATDADIAVMERHWMRKLQSREMGLNRNG